MHHQAEILRCVEKFRRHLEDSGRFQIVENASQIGKTDKIDVVLGLQHPPIDGELEQLADLGIRNMQIAYDVANPFTYGFSEPQLGLTDEGVELIPCVIENDMILDLAHASSETVRQVVKMFDSRFIDGSIWISHSGIHSLYNHPRNASVSDIEDLRKYNGVFGLYCLSFGLSANDDSLVPFVDHLEQLFDHADIDHANIVVATDGVYQNISEDLSREHFAMLSGILDSKGHFKARWPMEALDLNTPRKMEVLHSLIVFHFGDLFANAVCGENLRNFFMRALPD